MAKSHYLKIALLAALVALTVVMGLFKPQSDSMTAIFVVMGLIYVVASLFILIILGYLKPNYPNKTALAMLVGTLPPAMILLVSLKQATFLDIAIIIATVSLVVWYLVYKK